LKTNFEIAGRKIGEGEKAFVIAEVAQAHEGSLGQAHAYIDAVAQAGADAIKFQTHIAAAESSLEDAFRVKFSLQDSTRFEYWKRMEFSRDQWAGIFRHAEEKGLICLSSAFSVDAFEMLEEIGCPAWKVGSGEVTNVDLLEQFSRTGKPVLLSTGMSSYREIETALSTIRSNRSPVGLFQCTSAYPVALEDIGINVMEDLKTCYGVPVGLSDHSASIFPSLLAMARGASMVEIHVAFHRGMFGPDTSSSLTLDELAILCQGRDSFSTMVGNPVDKDAKASELSDMKTLFQKSVAVRCDHDAGDILYNTDIVFLKPGTGIPVAQKDEVIGRKLSRDVKAGQILRWDDLSNE